VAKPGRPHAPKPPTIFSGGGLVPFQISNFALEISLSNTINKNN